LIVHDEMDFPLGKLAFLGEGGAAGHNGVSSIHQQLGTEQVARLRLGIGRPAAPITKEDYVLQSFIKDEAKIAKTIIDHASEAIKDWIEHGIAEAMNKWNGLI
jgi:PTH1 family peptidyl-tRNA hydrolase